MLLFEFVLCVWLFFSIMVVFGSMELLFVCIFFVIFLVWLNVKVESSNISRGSVNFIVLIIKSCLDFWMVYLK